MSSEEIVISETGLTVLGFPLGFAPTIRDLELAFEGELLRSKPTTTKERELRMCDSKGLSWLVDLKHELVLWLDIRLTSFRYRKLSEVDPSSCFKGKVRIGQYTVHGPFSFETGEIVRKVTIPGLSVGFVPDENLIRSVSVAFVENERVVNKRRK